MVKKSDEFYTRLPVHDMAVSQLLASEDLFVPIPNDWAVVITDIENSTEAVRDGRHETVNLIATGSIIAVLNIARKAGIDVPFFFGGDGGTMIVPKTILGAVLASLAEHQARTRSNANLELRVGHIPLNRVYAEEHQLVIAKVKVSDVFAIPVVLGRGLIFAEELIKGATSTAGDLEEIQEGELDLEGMECRWDRITPPANADEVVSLLVVAQSGMRQSTVFKSVFDRIDDLYGPQAMRQPISESGLRLQATFEKIRREMTVKLPRSSSWYLFINWFYTFLGTFYFRYTKMGKKYLRTLVQLSDTLTIDGRINTVISGSRQQRMQLESALRELEEEGFIYFGLFASPYSIMSCYVRDRENQHIHFVDGSEGGYTMAAIMLKSKLRGTKV